MTLKPSLLIDSVNFFPSFYIYWPGSPLDSLITRPSFAIYASYQSVGRDANSAQSYDDGMVAITEAAFNQYTASIHHGHQNLLALKNTLLLFTLGIVHSYGNTTVPANVFSATY